MRYLLSICFIVSISFCVHADVKSEITALLHQQDEAWNRGDIDGFLAAYDRTGNLAFIGSTGVVRDYAVLKDHYEKRYKTGKADFGKLTFSDLQVEELAPKVARAWGRWAVQEKDKSSNGWFTLILKKEKNGWRIIHDHSS